MIEARFKAVARALRDAVAIDPTSRRPQTKGTLDLSGRDRLVDYGMGTGARCKKALEHVGAEAQVTATPTDPAPTASCAGRGRLPSPCQPARQLGLEDAACRGRTLAEALCSGSRLGMQLLFEHHDELGPPRGCGLLPGAVDPLQTAGAAAPAHRLECVRFQRPRPSRRPPRGGLAFYHVIRWRPTERPCRRWSAERSTASPSPRRRPATRCSASSSILRSPRPGLGC